MPAAKLAHLLAEAAQPSTPSVPRTSLYRIVLTGFMGAGKTTIGRLLAQQLGWQFLDLDAHIEQRCGKSIADLFADQGEPHFRRAESSALANALRTRNLVLALGGGAPETLTNRLLLEQTPRTAVVFLDAPFAVLFDRCMLQAINSGIDRPNLRDPALAAARFAARRPLYQRLARLTLGTDALDTETIVRHLAEALASLP